MFVSYKEIACLDKSSSRFLTIALDKAREEGWDPGDYYLCLAENTDDKGESYYAVSFNANEIGENRGSPSNENDPPSFTIYINKNDENLVQLFYAI